MAHLASAGIGQSTGNHRRLAVALVIAAAVHGLAILSLDAPTLDQTAGPPTIDIVLGAPSTPAPTTTRNSPQESTAESTATKPRKAQQDRPPPAATEPSISPQPAQPEQRAHSNPRIANLPYTDLAKEIAAAHARRERQQALSTDYPRTKRLSSASAKSKVEAAYLAKWRQKIERIGRANYPPGGISGELSLLATLSRDGTLQEVRILESSGHRALDEAALRIVRLAAPYSHFPAEMRRAYDQLEIVRRWRFARNGAFQ